MSLPQVIKDGLKGFPDCEGCQCYPECRRDCPDHLKCLELPGYEMYKASYPQCYSGTEAGVRYLHHPVMWPLSTWFDRFWCRVFGHDWVATSPGGTVGCYTCGEKKLVTADHLRRVDSRAKESK